MSENQKKTGAALARGKSKQDYSTPKEFIDAVVCRFGKISFDLAASAENTKAERFFGIEADSLKQQWNELDRNGVLWLNPPFDRIEPWAIKCAAESALGAPPILFLTPASVGANWFKQWVRPSAHVIFLNGRLCFDGKNGFPKDCMLSVYWGGLTGTSIWTWEK